MATSKGAVITALLALVAISVAETAITKGHPSLGLIVHGLMLITLFLKATISESESVRHFCIALTLAPLIKLVAFALPLQQFPILGQLGLLSVLLLIPSSYSIHYLPLGRERLGFQWKEVEPGSFLFAIILGILLGFLAHQLVRSPLQITTMPSSNRVARMLLVVVIATFVDELLFRGILLDVSREMLGELPALIYVSLLYGVLQIGYQSWLFILLAIATSLSFGWLVFRTRSIYVAMMAHICLNASYFFLFPLLG